MLASLSLLIVIAQVDSTISSNKSSNLHLWRNHNAPRSHKSLQIRKPGKEFDDRLGVDLDFFIIGEEADKFRLFEDQYIINGHLNQGKLRLAQMHDLGAKYKRNSILYNSRQLHSYEDFNELRISGGPRSDHQKCKKDLDNAVARAQKCRQEGSDCQDNEILRFLDVFGQSKSGVFEGDHFWLGSYDGCQMLRLSNSANGDISSTRYCIGSFSSSKGEELIEVGVCLPDSCDTLNLREKLGQIDGLIKLGSPYLKAVNLELSGIFCLPDEQSKLRTWYSEISVVLFVILVLGWITFLIFCTIKHSKVSQTNEPNSSERSWRATYELFSITSNFKGLISTKIHPKSSLDEGFRPSFQCLSGIKVLSAIYVMFGHVFMVLTVSMGNLGYFYRGPPLATLSNLLPAFAVNAFFCISGLLTSYQVFEFHKKHPFIFSLSRWSALVIFRYIRIMPVYLVVFSYAKLFAKYTGSGPFWDYGVSGESNRRKCEQESWLAMFTFTSNFKNPFEHCIQSAWYLGNDYQFFLVTPFLLMLLELRFKLARKIIIFLILLSFLSGFWSILKVSQTIDLRSVSKFAPSAFKTYVLFLGPNYTYPQNRISAYLIGLLYGHWLHKYKLDKDLGVIKEDSENRTIRWLNHAQKLAIFVLILLPLVPIIGNQLAFGPKMAGLLVALFMPSYHILFALGIGGYILSVATGHGRNLVSKFLELPFWRPLEKLSLCVMLVNIEVITYLVQSRSYVQYLDELAHFTQIISAVVATYICSSIVYVMFEAPLKSAQGLLRAKIENKKLD